MNIVVAGSRVQVYGEDVRTYKNLPNGCYNICFNQMTGFYLTIRDDLTVAEDTVYGNHQKKVDKVIKSFNNSDRNFGIILSGNKGCGKSLMARLLAKECNDNDMPVITATDYYPGIADFISSIDQKVMVLFDEFEKVFAEHEHYDPQVELLSLFDGIDNGHKLFVVTCNEPKKLNEYMLNRPGRFHYHFTITNPNDEEIEEYLTDKLKLEYHNLIPRIVKLSNVIDITYDYLRAIVFELNQGYSIEETFNDLNITRGDELATFNITVVNGDGAEWRAYSVRINLFSSNPGEVCGFHLYNKGNSMWCRLPVSQINFKNDTITVDPKMLDIDYDDDNEWEYDKEHSEANARVKKRWDNCKSITLERNRYTGATLYTV